jgi:hypothetical protein
MNQDQVKEKLLSLKVPCKDFTLVFSGKASKRVNGLYKPGDATIVIHNRNFTNDNALMYTALHEFTHHLMFARGLDTGRNHHTVAFWALFHSLITAAIKAGIYQDPYLSDEKLMEKRAEILDLLKAQNELNRKLGAAFSQMATLSKEKGARFEDFIDRHARIPRKEALTLTKQQYSLGLDEVGQESSPALVNTVVGQGKDMSVAAGMAAKGCSLQQIKAAVSQKKVIDPFVEPREEAPGEEQLETLEKHLASEVRKKEKLEKRICELAQEIEKLKEQQYSFGFGSEGSPRETGRRLSA